MPPTDSFSIQPVVPAPFCYDPIEDTPEWLEEQAKALGDQVRADILAQGARLREAWLAEQNNPDAAD